MAARCAWEDGAWDHQVEILCQMQRCTKAGGRLLWKIAVLVKASTVVLCWEGRLPCSFMARPVVVGRPTRPFDDT
eukprot:g27802.t1